MKKRILAMLIAVILVFACVASLAEDYTRVLKQGMEGDDVTYMQECLQSYGYYTGTVDGKFGKGMYKAVVAFQKKNDLKADGRIGKDTWNALTSADAIGKDDEQEEFDSLRKGDSGDAVSSMQLALQNYLYYNGDISGKFDTATYNALVSFQASTGLSADGVYGLKSYQALEGGTASIFKDGAVPKRTLKRGMRGYDVALLQRQLGLSETGYFDSDTADALKVFQSDNGLTASGSLDTATRKALWSGSDSGDSDEFTTLRKGATGDRVTAMQLRLRETYYYAGTINGTFDTATYNALKSFQASTGLNADGVYGQKSYEALEGYQASIFVDGAIPTRTLKRTMRGYDVYIVQQKLMELNYLTSCTDGYFDASTVAAVKKFQKANGIDDTGIVNSTTRRYLWPTSIDQQEQEDDSSKDTEYDTYTRPTLRLGSYGKYVSSAQMRLKAGGFLLGTADGIFGAKTKQAVIALQKEYGLEQDGVIGASTWEILMSFSLDTTEQTSEYDEESSSIGGVTNKLQLGDKGAEVTRLQTWLIDLGYLDDGQADGIFGRKTRTAVRKFQKDNKLTVDGVVGTKTYVKLYEALGLNGTEG